MYMYEPGIELVEGSGVVILDRVHVLPRPTRSLRVGFRHQTD